MTSPAMTYAASVTLRPVLEDSSEQRTTGGVPLLIGEIDPHSAASAPGRGVDVAGGEVHGGGDTRLSYRRNIPNCCWLVPTSEKF